MSDCLLCAKKIPVTEMRYRTLRSLIPPEAQLEMQRDELIYGVSFAGKIDGKWVRVDPTTVIFTQKK